MTIAVDLGRKATKPTNQNQDPLSLNAGQKYWRTLQRGHSATLSTFIKLPIVIKIFVLSIFEWTFYTGFTVHVFNESLMLSVSKDDFCSIYEIRDCCFRSLLPQNSQY